MKRLCIITLLLLAVTLSFGREVQIQTAKPMFTITEKGSDYYDLEFNLTSYQEEDFQFEGKNYKKIVHPEGGLIHKKGYPELPVFGTYLAIPVNSQVTIETIQDIKSTIPNYRVYPSQDGKEPVRGEIISINRDIYQSGESYPSEKVIESGQTVIRDLNLLNVSFQPFVYKGSSNELSISSKMKIRVHYSNPNGVSQISLRPTMSRAFEPLYEALVSNYAQIRDEMPDYQKPSLLIVYKTDANLQAVIDQLASWKRQKGFEVNLASTAVAGNSTTSIKAYIQNAYNTWPNPPEYIILVGDAGQSDAMYLPTYFSPYNYYEGAGDYPYTFLAGGTSDYLGDAIIGRLPVDTANQLQTILTKIKLSERNPSIAGNLDWYKRTVLVGDTSVSGQSCEDTQLCIKDKMKAYDNTYTFTEQYTNVSGSGIAQALNTGQIFMSYRGYYNSSGFNVSHINSLTNMNKLTNCVFITCDTGAFADGDSRIEAFVNAGSVASPKAGFTAVGMSTSHTHTAYNNTYNVAIFDGIFKHGIRNMGTAMLYSKLFVSKTYNGITSSYANVFNQWCNLMGDPSMDVLMGIPQTLNVAYNPSIPLGSNSIAVSVTDDSGNPVKDVWVTALAESSGLSCTGYTDENGQIVLQFMAGISAVFNLTATKPSYMPHTGYVTVSTEAAIGYQSVTIDDDNNNSSSGNNNHILNPGETAELMFNLKNYASTASAGWYKLSSTDPWVTITSDSVSFSSINPQQEMSLAEGSFVTISPACPNTHKIIFELEVNNGTVVCTNYFELLVTSSDLDIISVVVTGGQNSILDPGDEAILTLTINNNGTIAAENIYASLSTTNSKVTITDTTAFFGSTIAPYAQAICNTDNFVLSCSSQLIPGEYINFAMRLYNANGYEEIETFNLMVGSPTLTDPLGPDAYGYICYDDGDLSYEDHPTYNWIELHPTLGTNIGLNDSGNDDDATMTVTLPFSFRFYGVSYSQASICSNGWLTFGATTQSGFRNFPLPGAMGPSPIIAAFWDDLKLMNSGGTNGVGKLYTYYNSTEHYFVVEWYKAQNYANNAEETFQIILYDPIYYPTLLGDAPIKIQYKTISNIDTNSEPSAHSAYATMGIQDHTASVGLQYSYNNIYPSTAKTITNGTAILYTGLPMVFNTAHLNYVNTVVNGTGTDNTINPGETISLGVAVKNIGQGTASNVTGILSTTNPNVTIISNQSAYSNMDANVMEYNQTPYTIEVLESCPQSTVNFNLNVITNNENLNFPISIEVRKPALALTGYLLNDNSGNNDGVLDPGESVVLALNISNQSDADAQNINIALTSQNDKITIEQSTVTVETLRAQTSVQKLVTFTVSADAVNGNQGVVNYVISSDNANTVNGVVGFGLAQNVYNVSQNFETWPIPNWTFFQHQENWSQSPTNFAGGTAPELKLSNTPSTFTGTSRIRSDYYDVTGITQAVVSFRFMLDNYVNTGTHTIGFEIRNGTNDWTSLWSVQPSSDIPAQIVSIEVPAIYLNQTNLQFSFVFRGQSSFITAWYIDDFNISSSVVPTASLAGVISSDNAAIDFTEVRVKAGNTYAVPLTDGSYRVIMTAGNPGSLQAFLPSYYSQSVALPQINSGDDLTGYNLLLEYLAPPYNLNYTITDNVVNLTWSGSEVLSRVNNRAKALPRNQRDVNFLYYKVYRQINAGAFVKIDSTTAETYSDNTYLPGNTYHYYLLAKYVQGESQESSHILIASNNLTPQINSYFPLEDSINVVNGNTVQFTITATDPDSPFTCNWTVNDTLALANSLTFTRLFTHSGTYHVKAIVSDGMNTVDQLWDVWVPVSNIDPNLNIVTKLYQNMPNPFNPSTTISFDLKKDERVEVAIYNIKGQEVKKLVNRFMDKGRHSVVWNGKDNQEKQVSSGIYFYKMKTDSYQKIYKAVLLK